MSTAVATVTDTSGMGFRETRMRRTVTVYVPLPHWVDGTAMLALGFIAVNLLVLMEVADRLSLKSDLEIARDIQLAMLPRRTYEAAGVEAFGMTRPARLIFEHAAGRPTTRPLKCSVSVRFAMLPYSRRCGSAC